jgi:hypothetical protein
MLGGAPLTAFCIVTAFSISGKGWVLSFQILSEAGCFDTASKCRLRMNEIQLCRMCASLLPIPDPGKCVERNYRAHVTEAGLKTPEFPTVFENDRLNGRDLTDILDQSYRDYWMGAC